MDDGGLTGYGCKEASQGSREEKDGGGGGEEMMAGFWWLGLSCMGPGWRGVEVIS